jgi:hypothetical protein
MIPTRSSGRSLGTTQESKVETFERLNVKTFRPPTDEPQQETFQRVTFNVLTNQNRTPIQKSVPHPVSASSKFQILTQSQCIGSPNRLTSMPKP